MVLQADIGARIAAPLLRKIRTDLLNTVAEEGDVDQDGATVETVHRLDPTSARAMGIKSTDRHVRSRLYFTSESHLHSLLNALRFANLNKVGAAAAGEEEGEGTEKQEGTSPPSTTGCPKLSPQAHAAVGDVDEINYLTHIVIRVYELKMTGSAGNASPTSSRPRGSFKRSPSGASGYRGGAASSSETLLPRYRCEIAFSKPAPASPSSRTSSASRKRLCPPAHPLHARRQRGERRERLRCG